MKILYVGRSCHIGGVPNVRLRAAQGLIPLGHEVHLFAQNGPMADAFRQVGVRYHPAWVTPFNRIHLARLIKRGGFDIIHADNSTAGEDVLWAMEKAGFNPSNRPAFVVAVHGLFSPKVSIDPCLPRTDAVIVFDASTTTRLRQLKGMETHPIEMVRRPVEERSLTPRSNTSPALVLISRLSKSKAVAAKAAMEATFDLEKEWPGLTLTIIGDGSQRKELEARARTINALSGREVVKLTGALLDPFPLMARATCVIGTAMVAMEALFHEIPVVAAGYQGYGTVTAENFDEAVECNFGDAVLEPRPITKQLLVDGLRRVLAEGDSPKEKAALHLIAERLRSEHSVSAVSRRLETIYRNVINARRDPGHPVLHHPLPPAYPKISPVS